MGQRECTETGVLGNGVLRDEGIGDGLLWDYMLWDRVLGMMCRGMEYWGLLGDRGLFQQICEEGAEQK